MSRRSRQKRSRTTKWEQFLKRHDDTFAFYDPSIFGVLFAPSPFNPDMTDKKDDYDYDYETQWEGNMGYLMIFLIKGSLNPRPSFFTLFFLLDLFFYWWCLLFTACFMSLLYWLTSSSQSFSENFLSFHPSSCSLWNDDTNDDDISLKLPWSSSCPKSFTLSQLSGLLVIHFTWNRETCPSWLQTHRIWSWSK